MDNPHLILTTIHRLSADDVAPFFLSLRRAGFKGEVVVFASGVDPMSILQIERWGARVECFRFRGRHVANPLGRLWPVWKRIFASNLSNATKRKLGHGVFHLFYRRHLLYLDFLRASGARYSRILLTDCRDVFFQTDPFAWPQSPGLHVFLEDASMKIGQNPHHIRWITSQFGPETLEDLRGEIISCAGTVFGDYSSIPHYLEEMFSLTMRAQSLREADGDQGLHNFLVHRKGPPATTIHDNGDGPVMTVGAMRMPDLGFTPDGLVVNNAKEVAAVIHQYDRIPELREMLLARIGEVN